MSKRKLELIDQRGKLDAAITECRQAIDGHARGMRYAQVAEVGARLVKHAQAAEAVRVELDKLLNEEWEQRRR